VTSEGTLLQIRKSRPWAYPGRGPFLPPVKEAPILCSERSLVKTGDGWGVALPLFCRSWGCEICAPRRAAQLIALGKAGRPNRFLTLTIAPTVAPTAALRAKALANALRNLMKRVRRKVAPAKVEYLAVFEATKLGNPHLHVLLRSPFLAQAWISEVMRELIGSPICDIRQVKDAGHAARYVAKYIGKEPHKFGTCKRYWTSGNWNLRRKEAEEVDDGSRWTISEQPLKQIWLHWYNLGLCPTWRPHEWLAWGNLPESIARWASDRPPPHTRE